MSQVDDRPVRPAAARTGRRRGRPLAILVAVVAVVASVAMFGSPAQAYPSENYLRNWATGLCLDSNGAGDVYASPCTMPVGANQYQTWEPFLYMRVNGNDVSYLRNRATGRCLARGGAGGPSVRTEDCIEDYNRVWTVTGGWDQATFAVFTTGECLDSNIGQAVYLMGCNGGGYQKWKLGF